MSGKTKRVHSGPTTQSRARRKTLLLFRLLQSSTSKLNAVVIAPQARHCHRHRAKFGTKTKTAAPPIALWPPAQALTIADSAWLRLARDQLLQYSPCFSDSVHVCVLYPFSACFPSFKLATRMASHAGFSQVFLRLAAAMD